MISSQYAMLGVLQFSIMCIVNFTPFVNAYVYLIADEIMIGVGRTRKTYDLFYADNK